MRNQTAVVAGFAVIISVTACQSSDRQQLVPEAAPETVIGTVNDVPISEPLLAAFMRVQGRPADNEEARAQAIVELQNLILLGQQAERVGLTSEADLVHELAVQRLIRVAQETLADYAESHVVSEQEIEQEYQSQVSLSGAQRYKVRHMLASNEDDALALVERLLGGEDWLSVEAYARAELGDGNVGDLGWLDLSQLPPGLAQPVRNLRIGQFTVVPVATRFGHHVMYLEDIQDFEPPALEDVRNGIANSLQRRRVDAYLQALRDAADLQVGESE